jgi:hypothetical protein
MIGDYYEDLSVGQINDRGQIINLDAYWRDERREYSNGKLIFKGCHYRHNTDSTEDDWEIWKYTWSDGENVRIEGPLPGAWSKRRSLDWNETGVASTIDANTPVDIRDITEQILSQLKIMNVHLSILTNEEISNVG